jgi:hypothetical protein
MRQSSKSSIHTQQLSTNLSQNTLITEMNKPSLTALEMLRQTSKYNKMRREKVMKNELVSFEEDMKMRNLAMKNKLVSLEEAMKNELVSFEEDMKMRNLAKKNELVSLEKTMKNELVSLEEDMKMRNLAMKNELVSLEKLLENLRSKSSKKKKELDKMNINIDPSIIVTEKSKENVKDLKISEKIQENYIESKLDNSKSPITKLYSNLETNFPYQEEEMLSLIGSEDSLTNLQSPQELSEYVPTFKFLLPSTNISPKKKKVFNTSQMQSEKKLKKD